jgi:hypothetical protein
VQCWWHWNTFWLRRTFLSESERTTSGFGTAKHCLSLLILANVWGDSRTKPYVVVWLLEFPWDEEQDKELDACVLVCKPEDTSDCCIILGMILRRLFHPWNTKILACNSPEFKIFFLKIMFPGIWLTLDLYLSKPEVVFLASNTALIESHTKVVLLYSEPTYTKRNTYGAPFGCNRRRPKIGCYNLKMLTIAGSITDIQ